MTAPAVEYVDLPDVLRAAIGQAGGCEAYAKRAGVSLRAVWDALDDREPHHRILRDLGLGQMTVTYRPATPQEERRNG